MSIRTEVQGNGRLLKAPFPSQPYNGGKSTVAADVWQRFGDTPNFIEPFFGSGAILLGRPHNYWNRTESCNDACGLLANFWRSVKLHPEAVAEAADWIVSECDLHARHAWLCGQRADITRKLEGDPEWCDPKAAGWWVWGICSWIGSGWCAEHAGPWRVVDGELLNVGGGQKRQLPHLGDAGMGINRQLPHLGAGGGACDVWSEHLREIMRELQHRLRRVRVCCGDWERVCGDTPTIKNGITGVFLDPPYAGFEGSYSANTGSISKDVRKWAIEQGQNPMMRICLAGYYGEHDMPDDWECFAWKAQGGYGNRRRDKSNLNPFKERLWFSPYCIKPAPPAQLSLFEL